MVFVSKCMGYETCTNLEELPWEFFQVLKWLACISSPLPSGAASFHLNIPGQFLTNKCTPTSSTFDNLPSCLESNNVVLCFGQFFIDQRKIEMLCLLFSEHFHFILQLKSSLSFLPLQHFFVKELVLWAHPSLHLLPTFFNRKLNEDILKCSLKRQEIGYHWMRELIQSWAVWHLKSML